MRCRFSERIFRHLTIRWWISFGTLSLLGLFLFRVRHLVSPGTIWNEVRSVSDADWQWPEQPHCLPQINWFYSGFCIVWVFVWCCFRCCQSCVIRCRFSLVQGYYPCCFCWRFGSAAVIWVLNSYLSLHCRIPGIRQTGCFGWDYRALIFVRLTIFRCCLGFLLSY